MPLTSEDDWTSPEGAQTKKSAAEAAIDFDPQVGTDGLYPVSSFFEAQRECLEKGISLTFFIFKQENRAICRNNGIKESDLDKFCVAIPE